MKKSQFSEAKIVEILALSAQCQSIDKICRTHNISPATFYNWRQKYGEMDTRSSRFELGWRWFTSPDVGWLPHQLPQGLSPLVGVLIARIIGACFIFLNAVAVTCCLRGQLPRG
jgi:hypothetical protein